MQRPPSQHRTNVLSNGSLLTVASPFSTFCIDISNNDIRLPSEQPNPNIINLVKQLTNGREVILSILRSKGSPMHIKSIIDLFFKKIVATIKYIESSFDQIKNKGF